MLQQNRPGLSIVATGDAVPEARRQTPGPGTSRLSHKAFLDLNRPAAALFAGRIDPAFAWLVERQQLPAIWIDAAAPPARLWPRLARTGPETAIRAFDRILAADAHEAVRLGRLRNIAGKLEAPGPLQPSCRPLPYSLRQRDELAQLLAGRPVWMAVDPDKAEIAAIVEAHRSLIGQSHRLLLVLAMQTDGAEGLIAGLQAEGWHATVRSAGDDPAPETQIVVADDPDELGLWYRLSPISFLGGTLAGSAARRDPFEAAALGSALIHGPLVAPYEGNIQRLAQAGATRRVDTTESLARAVARLLSADVAASLAAAAWDVVTAGAPAMNRIAELVEALLDRGPQ